MKHLINFIFERKISVDMETGSFYRYIVTVVTGYYIFRIKVIEVMRVYTNNGVSKTTYKLLNVLL